MKQKKYTKRALCMSLLSLLLCCSMLVGTTFAWFTDSVTSGKNRIVAGNLDVDLLMDKEENGTYTSIADGEGDIFSEKTGNGINWEPGKTEIVYLAVRNLGTLALNYNIVLNITDGDPGLIGSLDYAVLDGKKAADLETVTSWTELLAVDGVQSGEVQAGVAIAAPKGTLDEVARTGDVNETDYFALAVHMKEEAGNEYQNGSITIDLTVEAKQAQAESDSFGDDYDAGTTFPVVAVNSKESLKGTLETLESGGTVVLQTDIDLGNEQLTVTGDREITIDLGGHEITSDSVDMSIVVEDGAELTVTGGKIAFTKTHSSEFGGTDGDIPYILVSNDEDSEADNVTLNLENCTVEFQNLESTGGEPLNGIAVEAADGKTATINIGEGTLIDCRMGSGAAVIMGANATVNMSDGKIISNNCEEQGGVSVYGVYLDDETSVFNMSGGEIEVTGVSGVSGVLLYDGTFNMTGGEINVTACSSLGQYGIAVENYFPSKVNMTGGTIHVKATASGNRMENTAFNSGSGVSISGEALVIIDQTVSGNNTGLGFNTPCDGVDESCIRFVTP